MKLTKKEIRKIISEVVAGFPPILEGDIPASADIDIHEDDLDLNTKGTSENNMLLRHAGRRRKPSEYYIMASHDSERARKYAESLVLSLGRELDGMAPYSGPVEFTMINKSDKGTDRLKVYVVYVSKK